MGGCQQRLTSIGRIKALFRRWKRERIEKVRIDDLHA
jgi:hypothetical protein